MNHHSLPWLKISVQNNTPLVWKRSTKAGKVVRGDLVVIPLNMAKRQMEHWLSHVFCDYSCIRMAS